MAKTIRARAAVKKPRAPKDLTGYSLRGIRNDLSDLDQRIATINARLATIDQRMESLAQRVGVRE